MTAAFQARIGPWGCTTCAVEDTAGAICGKTATKHLLVRIKHLRGLLNACDTCFVYLIQHHALIIDSHQFGHCCNLPDADWIPSTPEHPGTCQLPESYTQDIERFANQPEGALT